MCIFEVSHEGKIVEASVFSRNLAALMYDIMISPV
jgi:hypothetical protein